MSSKERPLGEVIEVLEKIGAEISYAYDDLVFVNHSAYLIQFGEKHKDINIFYNKECTEADVAVFKKDLEAAFKTKSFKSPCIILLCNLYAFAGILCMDFSGAA